MGFNTTVLVLNDGLHAIENDPEFGKKLVAAIMGLNTRDRHDVSALGHANAATAIETHHADGMIMVAVGGNTAKVLGYAGGYTATELEMVKNVAERLGYDLRKKPTKKVRK